VLRWVVGFATSAMGLHLELRPTMAKDLGVISGLEAASYPRDEAASATTLARRLEEAGDYFRTVWVDSELAGFICGTRCSEFTASAMSDHDPLGECLAIHSVVVAPSFRRRGVAARAVRMYCDEQAPAVSSIKLIAKAPLLGLYRRAGFEVLGLSAIEHGRDPWFECVRDTRVVDMVQVDAFTENIFGGNPAAVVFTSRGGNATWMQAVALENQLSETAFVDRRSDGAFDIRWFTPTTEVDLCGHATVAAAKALYATGRTEATEPIRFVTRTVGNITVEARGDWLEVDFPTADLEAATDDGPDGLLEALDVPKADVLFVGRGPKAVPDVCVELRPEAFARLDADLGKLADVDVPRGVCVTARSLDPAFAFTSRFFAPKAGIPEDPVTGSAHTLLTKYWETQLGTNDVFLGAYQASPRGGVLRCKTVGDRTIIQGQAVLVLAAKLRLP